MCEPIVDDSPQPVSNLDSRIASIDVATLVELVSSTNYQAYDMLPDQLSPDEIDELGFRISNLVEKVYPSSSGVTHGHKREGQTILGVGLGALGRYDYVTAASSAEHLSKHGGLSARLGSFVINWCVKRDTRQLLQVD